MLNCQGSSICTLGADKSNSTPWLNSPAGTAVLDHGNQLKLLPLGYRRETLGIPVEYQDGQQLETHTLSYEKMRGKHEAEPRTRRVITPGSSSGAPLARKQLGTSTRSGTPNKTRNDFLAQVKYSHSLRGGWGPDGRTDSTLDIGNCPKRKHAKTKRR